MNDLRIETYKLKEKSISIRQVEIKALQTSFAHFLGQYTHLDGHRQKYFQEHKGPQLIWADHSRKWSHTALSRADTAQSLRVCDNIASIIITSDLNPFRARPNHVCPPSCTWKPGAQGPHVLFLPPPWQGSRPNNRQDSAVRSAQNAPQSILTGSRVPLKPLEEKLYVSE